MLLLVVAAPTEAARVRSALEPLPMGADTCFVATNDASLALRERTWDVIILALPGDSLDLPALDTYFALAQGTPLLIIADEIDEQTAAQWIRLGAADVLSSATLVRLSAVIAREVRQKPTSVSLADRNQQPDQPTSTTASIMLPLSIAHDLSNVFTAMLCSTDVLLHEARRLSNSGEAPEIAFEIQTIAQRGIDLLRQLVTPIPTTDPQIPKITEKSDDIARAKPSPPRGNGEHLFIVDDEESLARIFGRLLQGLGYRVTVHTQPTKALESFEEEPASYHAALIDLHMPPPGGAAIAKRIRDLRPDLPIFIMSGYSDDLGGSGADKLHFAGVLQKPVLRETLAAELRRVLDRPVTP